MGTNAPAVAVGRRFSAPTPTNIPPWSVAHYIGQVAAAGKAELSRAECMFNASLRDPLTPGPASKYESGGATDHVLWIWKVAAPAIDVLAPDIYQNDSARYLKVLELYSRPDNALFVPETGGTSAKRGCVFTALGHGPSDGRRLVSTTPSMPTSTRRAPVDGGVARPSRAELPDSGADHA